jgi:glycosyltransferase involved in cell wall biosynthesis
MQSRRQTFPRKQTETSAKHGLEGLGSDSQLPPFLAKRSDPVAIEVFAVDVRRLACGWHAQLRRGTGIPMRVTHVITSLGVGGAEMMLWKLLSRLQQRGFQSEVICVGAMGEVGPRILALGVPVHALGMSRSWPNPLALFELARRIRRFRPDVVQTWMYHANLLGSIACRIATGAPLVWSLHQSNLDPAVNRRRTLWVMRACARFSDRAAAIVCCSEASRRPHAEFGYPTDKMQVIPIGFDVDLFRPDRSIRNQVRRELGVSSEAPLLGIVARFDVQKDHQTFVEAASHLAQRRPDARFLLCGTDITWQNRQLAMWIDDAGIRDRCLLLGRRDDVPRLMAALDILLSSSCGEAFPTVLGEAMACGVPCVVTDVGDSALIVGSTGRVVPRRDPRALADACMEMLNLSAEDRRRLGLQSRARIVNNFSLDAVAAAYIRLYTAVVAHPNALPDAIGIGTH